MYTKLQNKQQPYAVIIGLDSLQGIQAARILAYRGIPVIAIAKDPKHYGCQTKVCEKILFANTDEEVIRTLMTVGLELNQKAVLFPCQDGKVLLISRHRQDLEEWYHVVLPAPDVVEMMADKISFYDYAQKENLPVPPTFFLYSRKDAIQAAKELHFPCIMKPPFKSRTWSENTALKAFKATNAEELLVLYDKYHKWAEALIVQELIEGVDANHFTCNCYFDDDAKPLATFVTRKLRQWPPKTGQACLAEETQNDVVLKETIRLFRSLNYHGLGYLEMKRDERSGRYFIIEPNIGRPTGRSASAEASGVELLYTMYCDAIGWPLPPNREQKYEGVKWIYLRQDLQSVLHYWRQENLSLKECLQSWHGRKIYALFSWRDPVPFFSDFLRVGRLLLSRQERRKREFHISHRDS